MDLLRAARTLRCDRSPAHAGRRRRAAAKLAAGIAVLQPSTPGAGVHAALLGAALQELGVPVNDLLADLFTQLHSTPPPSRVQLEVAVQRFLDRTKRPEFAQACCACLTECVAGSDGKLSGVYFKSFVHRNLANLKSILDPQQWDDPACGKGFFAETSHAGQTCETASIDDPTSNDPTPGKGWKGVLFEHFLFDDKSGNSGSMVLRNFLNIDIQEGPTSYLLDYGLCKSLSGSMTDSNGTVTTLGLEEDCGYSSASDVGLSNVTHLTGVKHLEYTVSGLHDLSVLALMIMAETITYDALCCGGAEAPTANCDCSYELCSDEGELPDGEKPPSCR
jgi:hypothetical protein